MKKSASFEASRHGSSAAGEFPHCPLGLAGEVGARERSARLGSSDLVNADAGHTASPARPAGRGRARYYLQTPPVALAVRLPSASPPAATAWRLDPRGLLRWEQDGNTRAVHKRSRLVSADPVRSQVTWANDGSEQTSCRVVLADVGLQNQ